MQPSLLPVARSVVWRCGGVEVWSVGCQRRSLEVLSTRCRRVAPAEGPKQLGQEALEVGQREEHPARGSGPGEVALKEHDLQTKR